MVRDPVCGMEIDHPAHAVASVTYAGHIFYFCAQGCKDAFEKEPGRYLWKAFGQA
jgi:YHS domain-containing protein